MPQRAQDGEPGDEHGQQNAEHGQADEDPPGRRRHAGRAEQFGAERGHPLADADQDEGGEDEADQSAEQGVERDPALEETGDLDVGRAHEVEHLDRRPVQVERGAGGQHDGGGGGADHQQDEPGGQPFQRPDQGGERSKPLTIVVDPGGGRRGGDRAGQLGEPGMGLGRQVDVDQRRHRDVLGDAPLPEPGHEQPVDLLLRHRPHGNHARLRPDRRGRGLGLRRLARRIGLDDLDGDPTADLLVETRRGGGEAHARRGGEHGQEHHDRDHPGHRPGQPPLGQQAALGPAELARAGLHRHRALMRQTPPGPAASADGAARRSDRRSGRGRAAASRRAGSR